MRYGRFSIYEDEDKTSLMHDYHLLLVMDQMKISVQGITEKRAQTNNRSRISQRKYQDRDGDHIRLVLQAFHAKTSLITESHHWIYLGCPAGGDYRRKKCNGDEQRCYRHERSRVGRADVEK